MKLIVDGNHLASRCRFAKVRELGTSDGRASGVIYGVFRGISSVASKLGISSEDTYVVWDGCRRCDTREQICPEYKANRYKELTDPKEIADLEAYRSQLGPVRDGLTTMGIKQVRVDGCEADDIISVVSMLFSKICNETVTILSGDKDFHQLVSKEIRIYDPHSETVLGPAQVCERWNCRHVGELVLIRAIQGDPSDNILGVPQVGEKRAPFCARFLTVPERDVPKEWIKHVTKVKQNLAVIERNIAIMRLPKKWEETFYTPEQGIEMLTQLSARITRDERALVSFLRDWEMENVFETSRW